MKWRWGMIRWRMKWWIHEMGWWWWNMMLWYDGAGCAHEPPPKATHYWNTIQLFVVLIWIYPPPSNSQSQRRSFIYQCYWLGVDPSPNSTIKNILELPGQPVLYGGFNWMIQNLYMGNGWKSPNIQDGVFWEVIPIDTPTSNSWGATISPWCAVTFRCWNGKLGVQEIGDFV